MSIEDFQPAEVWGDKGARLLHLLSKQAWSGNPLNNGNGEPLPKYRDKRPYLLRLKHWWRDHRPVFHWGECDHDDCYYADESPRSDRGYR